MRCRVMSVAIGLCVGLGVPSPAFAWGYEAHKFIMDRAIDLLPAGLRPLFEANRAMLRERSIDPDTWQLAGFGEQEAARHFLNLDADGYGAYPHRELPRDRTAADAKFGAARVAGNGTLPWRVEEYSQNLRRAFAASSRRGPFAQSDILFFSAWLAHYVSDAHVPFHAVVNYDGQRTGQRGIHARFETFLFERFRDRLTISPRPLPPIRAARDHAFGALLEGTRLVGPILVSDAKALGDRKGYDDPYYAAFFAANRPVLERRLGESSAAVAAIIAGAWEEAGRPRLQASRSRVTQPRRR